MVAMIIEIILDMKYFLLVLILATMGYANSYYVIQRNAEEEFAGNEFWRANVFTWEQVLGEFNTDGFEFRDKTVIYLIWFTMTVMTLLVLLNLLIAIMGDTFARVQETSENNMWKEITGLMVENEVLINRMSAFKKAKYIIVIEEEKAGESIESWQGRIKSIQKQLNKETVQSGKKIKELNSSIKISTEKNIEEQVSNIEAWNSKRYSAINDKMDEIERIISTMQPQEEEENDEEEE